MKFYSINTEMREELSRALDLFVPAGASGEREA
jgi:hypothetical protein